MTTNQPKEKPVPEENLTAQYQVTAAELRSFIERFERLDFDKLAITDQQKEVMAEAKARGYSTKVIRKMIAERKKSREERQEEEALLELYRNALERTE